MEIIYSNVFIRHGFWQLFKQQCGSKSIFLPSQQLHDTLHCAYGKSFTLKKIPVDILQNLKCISKKMHFMVIPLPNINNWHSNREQRVWVSIFFFFFLSFSHKYHILSRNEVHLTDNLDFCFC